jgi:alkylation response protein AidB-like acyl-CoA dehydrogenase
MAIDLSLHEHQQLVQRSANELFRKRCTPEVVRDIEAGRVGYQPEVWREMAGLGWHGITFPEAYGGTGGSFLDLYPIYEEMGRFLVPTPHLDTVAVAGDVILHAGTEAQRDTLLPAIAEGRCIISLAALEADGAFGPRSVTVPAERRGDGFTVTGTKLLVAHAPSADWFLVPLRTSGSATAGSGSPSAGRAAAEHGISVLLVDAHSPGIMWSPMRNIAGQPLYAVTFHDVSAPDDALVGRLDGGWAALSSAATKAAVLQTATIVGAARRVLEMTNQYAKDRQQFGSPVGRYQAVQYLVTDILIDLHRADLLAQQAAFRIDAGKTFEREAAIAVAFGKRAAAHLHRQAHEVHAGVGFMLEHDLTLYSRRAKYWENNLGDARYYEDLVVGAMGI